MKRTLLSLLVSAGFVAQAQAVNLVEVYQQALQHDPVLQQADAQRKVAMSGVDISKADLLPQLTGQLDYQFQPKYESVTSSADANGNLAMVKQKGDTKSWGATLNLQQLIFDRGVWVKLDQAEKTAAQTEVSYGSARQDLINRVANAYFTVLQAQDTLAFRKAEQKAIERQLEQTKQRFAVGLTAITDVHEAQAQYDASVANVINAQNTLDNSYEGLTEITGVNYTNLDVLNTNKFDPNLPQGAVNDWVKRAEDNNLSLQAQRMSVDIARDQIKYAQSGHYPTVNLTGSYGTSKTDVNLDEPVNRDLDQPSLNNASIGIGVSVPIFSGFRTSSQVEQAQSQFLISSEELERIHRQVVRNVRNTYNNVKASLSSVKAYEQSVISSQSALEATEAGFEVGTRTIVDVLNSNQNLYQAKQQLAQARYNFILNNLALKQYDGTLADSDLDMINRILSPAAEAPKPQ
ncbi:outer membrane channel protein TolC [Gallaecimonas pentaromativorans]|uniref:Protein CyaE n=1 Tax=Gallaecimonas pentaromativorans TaxID=584787 RepID=A0A3N1PJG9_9GAMM|nr:outer membrane channel protein TolC [Gallaecimonas pentaromativorans]MED5524742.1 outer membrane channel protein TolC [Pseudomonadota bacterium]ROQ28743.1 outer membrane protein [Gallaecimonas pentaromativorans]